jgi:hypothetical protein
MGQVVERPWMVTLGSNLVLEAVVVYDDVAADIASHSHTLLRSSHTSLLSDGPVTALLSPH